ncbi:MAG: hypothetical protein WC156_04700, partial [Pedobacter sp.]
MTTHKTCYRIHQFVILAALLLLSSPVLADMCGGGGYNALIPGLSGFTTDPNITESLPTIDIPADFGGVSLSKTADLMLNITDVSGATFDEATGQIILYGKNPVSLPAMKLDDLSVAVRSVYGYGGIAPQDPGVSIGTETSTIPGQMKVRYDGQTFNTGFGYTMFESDRLLKGYTLGKDNISGATVTSTVPGYVNLLDRYRNAGWNSIPGSDFTNRMWFVPKDVSLIKSTDNSSMLFSNVSMQLLTETKFKNNTPADTVAEAFASHFTLHYDDFAIEKPILGELKRLGKITAVVKWIMDNNIPFDLSFFDNYTPAYDSRTPSYTPSTTVSKTWSEYGIIRTLTMTGGVQYLLDASNFSSAQGASADQAQTAALAARPGEGNFNWSFSSGGQSYQAIAQSMSRARKDGNIKRTEIDMMFPVQGKNPLILFRYYNSFNDKSTGFGFGWETSPYKLRFPATKQTFTFNNGSITVSAYPQIYISEKGKEYLYELSLGGLDALKNPVYARDGGKDYLKAEGGGFVLYKMNQGTVTFDSAGKFTRITDSNGIYINYAYSGSNLVSITHQSGRSITINYTSGKITSAVGPGGKTITYTYNANGNLETAKNEENEAITYQYDADRRLNNVIDPRGNAVFHASFDDYNRATGQTLGNSASYTKSFNLAGRMSTVTDPKNVSYTQTYDTDYRLLSMTDTANRSMHVTYAGEFGPSTVTDSKNNTTQYQYDDAGNINYIKDGNNKTSLLVYDVDNNPAIVRDARGYDTVYVYDLQNRLTEIRHVAVAELGTDGKLNGNYGYDPSYVTAYTYDPATGNLLSVRDPDGRLQQFTYDVNGLPRTSTLQGGYTVTNTYDTRSRLQNVTNPASESVTYGYDNADRVTSITTSAGVVRYVYDKNGNVSTAYDGKNNPTVSEYNINNKVTKVTDAENGITGYIYDSTNTRLAQITLSNGAIKTIGYDTLNRPINENNQVTSTTPKPVVLQAAVSMGSTTAGVPSVQHVTVCNSGQVSTSITNTATNNPLFTVSPAAAALAPQQCADLTVTFNGTSMGSQSGTLTITYGNGTTANLNLSAGVIVTLNTRAVSDYNGIQLTWNQYTVPALFSQYRVYRSASPITTLSGLTPITTISTLGTTSYLDTTATMGTKYYYSVVAFDSGGTSLSSVESVGPVDYMNVTTIGAPINLTTAVNVGRSPAIAFNSNASYRDYLIVYEYDTSGSGTNWDIYGQRMSGDGQKIGSPFAILSGAKNESNPRVAYNSTNNEYLVVAQYDTNGSGLYQIMGQRVAAGGTLAGSVITVYGTSKAQYSPDVAYNSTNNTYLVAFDTLYNADTLEDVVTAVLSNLGVRTNYTVHTYSTLHFTRPRLAYNSTNNQYLMVFKSIDSYGYTYINGYQLTSIGAEVNTAGIWIDNFSNYNDANPNVAYNGTNNEYAVIWEEDDSASGDRSLLSTVMRTVGADGTLAGFYQREYSDTITLTSPTISHDTLRNEYFVVLATRDTSSGEYDKLRGLRLDSSFGFLTAAATNISIETANIQRKGAEVFNLARSEFMVAYEYLTSVDNDVRGQRIGNVINNLVATPAALDFGTGLSQLNLHLDDITGVVNLYLNNSTDQTWLTVSPALYASPTPSANIMAAIDRTKLTVGSHTGNVLIISNGFQTIVPVTVSIVNASPSAPANPAPQNNTTTQFNVSNGLTANLGWDCTDSNFGDTLSYDVYLSETQTLVNNSDPTARIITGASTKLVSSTSLKFGKTYYWRVKAKDSFSASTLGPVWSFTTVSIPTPLVIAYTPNSTKNTSPTLAWNGISGIAKYHLQIANNPAFSPLLADYPNVTATSQAISQTLPNGKMYWRVAGIDSGGVQGAFSPASDLTVDTVPPTVQLTSPSGLVGKTP